MVPICLLEDMKQSAAMANDNYLIAPGDKLDVWIWGAVNFSNVVTVDNQGNISFPDVSPINVKNVPASQINNLMHQQDW